MNGNISPRNRYLTLEKALKSETKAKMTVNVPKFEINQVLHAPLVLELEIAAQLMIKIIQKVPPEGQPAAVAAALAEITAMQTAAENLVSQFPKVPHQFSDQLIEHQAQLMQEYLLENLEKS